MIPNHSRYWNIDIWIICCCYICCARSKGWPIWVEHFCATSLPWMFIWHLSAKSRFARTKSRRAPCIHCGISPRATTMKTLFWPAFVCSLMAWLVMLGTDNNKYHNKNRNNERFVIHARFLYIRTFFIRSNFHLPGFDLPLMTSSESHRIFVLCANRSKLNSVPVELLLNKCCRNSNIIWSGTTFSRKYSGGIPLSRDHM